VTIDALKAQLSVLEQQEKRYKDEIEDMRRERKNQQKLFDQIKAHQDARDSEQSEMRQKLNAEIEDSKKKISHMKEKLEAERAKASTTVESLEITIKTSTHEIEQLKKRA
jgi:chromosome segregation ATPase